ncbi:MAG: hypothetical protein GY835_21075 [bacterium]|nr:hypothetical protein [bacterium]
MKRRSLLAALLVCLATVAGAVDAEWTGSGHQGTLRLTSSGMDSSGEDPLEYVVALPETGSWHVRAVQIDGVPVETERVIDIMPPRVFRRTRVGCLSFVANTPLWRDVTIHLAFDESLPADRGVMTDPALRNLFVNPGQARQISEGTSGRAVASEIFDGNYRFIRIDVSDAGIYSLDYNALRNANLPVGTDLTTLKLQGALGQAQPFNLTDGSGSWERGWEPRNVPLQILGGDTFNVDSEIRFYAVGLDCFRSTFDPTADWTEYYRSFYAVWDTYFLSWGTDPGSTVGNGDAEPQVGDSVLDRLPVRLHKENNFAYSPSQLLEDGWAWSVYNKSMEQGFTADPVSLQKPAAGSDLRMRIGFDAIKDSSHPRGPHHVQGFLGSRDAEHMVNDESFDIVSSRYDHVLDGTIALPADLVGVESSTFYLFMPNDPPLGLEEDFGYLLWYELFYDMQLETTDSAPLDIYVPANGGRSEVTLAGWNAEPEIWDITDPEATQILSNAEFDQDELRMGLNTATMRHLLVVDPTNGGSIKTPVRVQAVNPTPLRNDDINPDMIVIYHDAFQASAMTYAAFRQTNFPSESGAGVVETVAVSDIYANFGHGMQDVAAIRNFLKYRYDAPDSRLLHVLLLGDASYDYRNFYNHEVFGDGTNCLVPALSDRTITEQSPSWDHSTDDYFCFMDLVDSSAPQAIVDLAIGRLPAQDVIQAGNMVSRIIEYESDTEPGIWRNRVVIAADDNYKPGYPGIDTIQHTPQADMLDKSYLPPEFDVEKIYLCEYEMEPSHVKIKAQMDLLEEINEGILLFNFIGHGGDGVLTDEKLLLTQNLNTLHNAGRRFLFISSSCNVGQFDSPLIKSMTETMVGISNGGAIATLASTSTSNPSNNSLWHRNIISRLFPDRTMIDSAPVGVAMMQSKVAFQDGNDGRVLERYVHLGDPAVTLAMPEMQVELECVPADTMKVGELMSIHGQVVNAGLPVADFNGEVMLSVRASQDDRGCEYLPDLWHIYNTKGPEVFRGRVQVTNGEFQSPEFFIPGLSTVALGSLGKIRAFATSETGCAVGCIDSLEVVTGVLPSDDTPPEVHLQISNGTTSGVPGMAMNLTASAPAGINMLGNRPHNSIFLEYVEMGEVENLTERFEYDLGSATSGSVSSVLPSGIDEGLNTIVASVADNLGNVGHDTLTVRIYEEGRVGLFNVQPFPNPFADNCMIGFEVSAPADVECRIYTITGRRVRILNLECPDAAKYHFDWDGRGEGGDPVGFGTYLYRLRAIYRDDPDRVRESTGALVKIGD